MNICKLDLAALFTPCRDSIVNHFDYLYSLNDHVRSLEKETSELKSIRDDEERRVEDAVRRGFARPHQVDGWLATVQSLDTKSSAIQADFNKLCVCLGCCRLNFLSGYSIGRRAVKLLKEVVEAKQKTAEFKDKLAERLLPSRVKDIAGPSTVGTESTLASALKELSDCFEREEAGIVGIYGAGGIGKTTLLKRFNNEFRGGVDHSFDEVMLVVVSKEPNLGRIQKEIGKRFGLSWAEGASVDERASDLLDLLSKTKFVLLLDDLWGPIDLDMLGIPYPNERNKCKVVVASRFEHVCDDMGVGDKKIKLRYLEKDEAWDLFRKSAGETLVDSFDIRPIAEDITRECGGLPLALIVVGRAMASKKTEEEWMHAASALKRHWPSEIRGMEEKLFHQLKISYDSLPDVRTRECFLYCCLFPEDHSIFKSQLVELWIGEGFMDEYGDDLDVAHNKVHDIIGFLKSVCLLEGGEDENTTVKMHDVIRDMALWIANVFRGGKNHKFLVNAGVGLKEVPDRETWMEAERISLMLNEVVDLPERAPNCYHLLTLLLHNNQNISRIPTGFFEFMPSLRVLDLSWTSIEELPVGIGELVELRHLDLSATNIATLPKELGGLARLRRLRLQRTDSLISIPNNVISRLLGLQVLDLQDSGYVIGGGDEGVDDLDNDIDRQVGLQDLEQLDRLKDLRLELKSDHSVRQYLASRKLRKITSYLAVIECPSLTSFILSSASGDMERLQHLELIGCRHMKELIIGEEDDYFLLKSLKFLTLKGLRRLESIIAPHNTLRNLRTLRVQHCDTLKNINWVSQLRYLERISLEYCNGMKHIAEVVEDDILNSLLPFTQVKILKIHMLPELLSICTHPLTFPSLVFLNVRQCPKMIELPLNSTSAPNLKQIQGEQKWWDELRFSNRVCHI
ncbi:Disease resistance protein RPS2 [Acorus calamus]|uniref:Disease resistance protein RPS2 n=1 Tax=Acorus calamus TaxID=4465 RepID=A0AAV9C1M0_ACOCL|nr:Disease resistance protein RPS2 [Acorus calamus]